MQVSIPVLLNMRAKKVLKIFLIVLGFILVLLFCFAIYVYNIADEDPPQITHIPIESANRQKLNDSAFVLNNNWIKKNEFGLYEMFISGEPYERGVIAGKLSKELITHQEIAFTHQIRKMIPSESYLKFLKYVIGFMNRGLEKNVAKEYQQEIYGISRSASDSFKWIGTKYSRILNYHAAHDIGHALQNLMLVGCTSFGAWNEKTENGAMILGRNFDFWVGDEFAENKIVEFVAPKAGFKFAYITWGGFIGVVSGMNEKGLTITINAAPSNIPFNAATPVSLVSREILQYASTINEAIAIARTRDMFVSESFMVSSAKDKKTVVIEKTPDDLDVYESLGDFITSTNHYQGEVLGKKQLNREHMHSSSSVYRQTRLNQLMEANFPLNPEKVANILRDQKGFNNTNIGYGNEKAINQLIAHHSIIFMPDSLRFWVSSAPWQLGTYVCYDLKKIFAMNGLSKDSILYNKALNIAPDSFLKTQEFADFLEFRKVKYGLMYNDNYTFDPEKLLYSNPQYYDLYRILGDYHLKNKDYPKAREMYEEALNKVTATQHERESIQKKLDDMRGK